MAVILEPAPHLTDDPLLASLSPLVDEAHYIFPELKVAAQEPIHSFSNSDLYVFIGVADDPGSELLLDPLAIHQAEKVAQANGVVEVDISPALYLEQDRLRAGQIGLELAAHVPCELVALALDLVERGPVVGEEPESARQHPLIVLCEVPRDTQGAKQFQAETLVRG